MRSIHKVQNSAVAGVIEALLLVGLVAIIISMIQLVYIPQIMEQREADHMDQVFNQFSTMKSMVDMQAMSESSSPISSVLTLGSSKLPYFLTVQSQGKMALVNESTSSISLDGAPLSFLSSLEYDGMNVYFIEQNYILEGGGIIIKQPNGSPVMQAEPAISVTNSSNIILHFNLSVFIDRTGKTQTQGEGKCFVRTTFLVHKVLPTAASPGYRNLGSGETIRIYSKYAAAWNQALHNILGEFDRNHCINLSMSSSPSYAQIKPGTKNIDLYIDIYEIEAQIGPGWVE